MTVPPPGRSRLLRVIPVKVINEGVVHYVPGWDPEPLLRTITLPVYQELFSPAPVAYSQQFLDPVNRAAIHYFRGRRWSDCRDQGTVLHRLDLADMEGGMCAQGSGQAKTDSSRIDDLRDGERTHEPRCQLFRWNSEV